MLCSRVERPGIDVDRDQRLGLVDDEIAAGTQRHLRREHRVELGLDAAPREQGLAVAVGLDVLGMAGHQHAHEVLGLAVGVFAGDQDLVDVLVVEVADRALDQAALLVDQRRRGRAQRQLADVLPKAEQVLEVALHLRFGAGRAGGAQNDAHPLGHFEIGGELLQPLAVGGAGDLARDAAAARRVRHEDAVAAGERKIGGERRALVAALLLDHLDEEHLAALDHFLDLVLAEARPAPLGQLLQRVFGADRFDPVVADDLDRRADRFLVAAGPWDRALAVAVAAGFRRRRFAAAIAGERRSIFEDQFGLAAAVATAAGLGRACRDFVAARRRRLARRLARFRFGRAGRCFADDGIAIHRRGGNLDRGGIGFAVLGLLAGGRLLVGFALLGLLALRRFLVGFSRPGVGLGEGALLLLDQRLPVGDRDLVVVRMDFREGEEAVAVAAVVDERRLERRLDAGDFR